jgi:hypothetical protein
MSRHGAGCKPELDSQNAMRSPFGKYLFGHYLKEKLAVLFLVMDAGNKSTLC